MILKARPTIYRGIQMRSRLEARFAESLDRANAEWVYEPVAFAGRGGQYLPDFQIMSEMGGIAYWDTTVPCYVEVKPTQEYAEACRGRMEIIWESIPGAYLVAVFLADDIFRAMSAVSAADPAWYILRPQRPA